MPLLCLGLVVGLFLLLIGGFPTPAIAADPQVEGVWPDKPRLGTLRSVTSARIAGGEQAVIAGGVSGVHVVEVSPPGLPRRIAVFDTPGSAESVAVSGGTLYVADGIGGLAVLDASVPGELRSMGRFDNGGYMAAVAVSGNRVWIADREGTVLGMDVTLPRTPILRSSHPTTGQALDLVVAGGDRLYVLEEGAGLVVYDAATAGSLAFLGVWNQSREIREFALVGTRAYLAEGQGGVAVVDFAVPSSPVLLGRWNSRGSARGAAPVDAGGLWVADAQAGITWMNVGAPAAPGAMDGFATGGLALGVATSGSRVLVLDDVAGLAVFGLDGSGRITPRDKPWNGYPLEGWARDVAVIGNTALVADGRAGLRVLNLTDTEHPVEVLRLPVSVPGDMQSVAVSGTRLFIGSGPGGLEIMDVTRPEEPSRVGIYREPDAGSDIRGVAVVGNLAYLAAANRGLMVVEAPEGQPPRRLATVATGGSALGVAVTQGHAYVAAETAGLVTLDIRNPAGPEVVRRLPFPGRVRGVTLSGKYLYLAVDDVGLHIVDIALPDAPRVVGSVDTSGLAFRVIVTGDTAILSEGESGIRIVRVSDPTRPFVVGGYDTDGFAEGLALVRGRLVVADGSRVQVISIPGVTPPPNVAPSFRAGTSIVVAEDDGDWIIGNWARDIIAGPAFEAGQTVRFGPVSVHRPELFAQLPSVEPNGTLRFRAAPDANGVAVCGVWLEDDGGRGGGGVDRSPEHVFRIEILPVNDPPRINPLPSIEWTTSQLGKVLLLSGIAAGPPDERQGITIRVVSDTPEGVRSNPIISYRSPGNAANVYLRSEPGWFGRAWLTVVLEDDGGRAKGGSDRTEVRVRVTVRPSGGAPFVTVDSPANDSILEPEKPVEIVTTADAANGTIETLELFIDGEIVESRTVGLPHAEVTWLWANPARGTHFLVVRAIDHLGQASLSSATRVVVARHPTLTGGDDLVLLEDTPSAPIPFELFDEGADPERLILRFTSADPAVIPAGGLFVGGSGAVRTLEIVPASNASGLARLEAILVNPDGLAATNAFSVRVLPVNDPPVVYLVEPRSTARFQLDEPIMMQAVVGDADGDPLDRVEFLSGDTVIGTVLGEPYLFQWTGGAPGEHALAARAVDSEGASTVSGRVNIVIEPPPNMPPTLLDEPETLELEEDSTGASFEVALADDRTPGDDLILTVVCTSEELVPASRLVVSGTGNRRTVQVRPAPDRFGEASLILVLEDADGARTTRTVRLQVNSVNDLPRVTLLSPVPDAEFAPGVVIDISLEASDLEDRLGRVELLVDGAVLESWTVPPFRFAWTNPPPGEHTLEARATDLDGGNAMSPGVRIRVAAPPVNLPPSLRGGGPVTVFQDGTSAPIEFEIDDDRTSQDRLELRAVAADVALLPVTALRWSGTGRLRTLVVVPAAGRFGTTTLEVMVRDEEGLSAMLVLPVSVLGAAELPGGEPCFADTVPSGYGTFNVVRQGRYRQEPGGGDPVALDGAASIELRAPPTYSVLTATVLGAGGVRIDLTRREDGLLGWVESGPESEAAARVPPGAWNTSFRLRLPTGESFNGFFPFLLVTNVPPVPRITNLDAASALDPGSDFLLQWTPWSGAVTNDRVFFEIRDAAGALVISAASDCSGQLELGRRSDHILVPAGKLTNGASYTGQLTFGANQLAVNDKGPLLMLRAFHSRTTRFPLRTLAAAPASAPVLNGLGLQGGQLRFTVNALPGTVCRVESSADFVQWTYETEVTVGPSGGADVVVAGFPTGSTRFYRVLVSGAVAPDPR